MPDTEKPVIIASQRFEYLPDQGAGFTIGTIDASDDVHIVGFSEGGGDP
jgi:hypothetical protein